MLNNHDDHDDHDKRFREVFLSILSLLQLDSIEPHAKLDSLDPILQFLPGYQRRRGSQSLKTIRGVISPDDWSRLQSYASRVRGLIIPPHTLDHSSVWSFLARHCAGTPLFPDLRVLDAYDITDRQLTPLLLVLCSSLRDVAISFEGSRSGSAVLPDILGSVLQTLAQTAPQLKILNLLGDHSLDREHLLHLERFSSIQEITFGPQFHFDEAVLFSISKIPTLRDLNIAVRLKRLGRGETRGLDFGDGFRKLHTLGLRGKSKDLSAVVAAMSPPALEWFELDFVDSIGANSLEEPLATIAAHIPDTIKHYSSTFCSPLSHAPTSLTDLLQQLLSKMPDLVSFHLFSDKTPLSVTNDDLVRIGNAWPQLDRLNVRQWTGRYNQSGVRRPTVAGLAELAKRCPKLTDLSLPELSISKKATAAASPSDSESESGSDPRAIPLLDHHLKELLFQSLSNSPAGAQYEAAVALDMIFPHLDLGRMRLALGGPSARACVQWMNVWRTLQIMRLGRNNQLLRDAGAVAGIPKVPEIPVVREERTQGLHGHGVQVAPAPAELLLDPSESEGSEVEVEFF
ncbi:hypothetical protein GSI_04837 [Ganoderma sinense ZZ0214-1]|uniref:Uncharacterized protein n=1 Tax=Ganoderma sinense ZZ0214-1 TaxID=1077348 RepID=A0A2G8SG41_9APHY|nr:hypothetical protein GSI_04837 [Ganoderma sinense ZZ0214-1]